MRLATISRILLRYLPRTLPQHVLSSATMPLWTNFPPPFRPAFSKRGLRGPSDDLKAKYLLVPVMMEAAAAQRFTLSATLSSYFESLVHLALLRRRAGQDLWAQCYRLRLRLRMRCTVFVCAVVSEGAGTRQEPNPRGAAVERRSALLNAARKIPYKAFLGV